MYIDIGSIVSHPHNPEIEDHFLQMRWYISTGKVLYFFQILPKANRSVVVFLLDAFTCTGVEKAISLHN